MGRPVARKGDLSSGHRAFPPRPSIEGSPTVLVNGRPAMRIGDEFDFHSTDPEKKGHKGHTTTGTDKVKIDGKSTCRIGDSISCGDKVSTGSENVLVG